MYFTSEDNFLASVTQKPRSVDFSSPLSLLSDFKIRHKVMHEKLRLGDTPCYPFFKGNLETNLLGFAFYVSCGGRRCFCIPGRGAGGGEPGAAAGAPPPPPGSGRKDALETSPGETRVPSLYSPRPRKHRSFAEETPVPAAGRGRKGRGKEKRGEKKKKGRRRR